MELREIRTFQKAAELENFSKAAEALGYTQAAVTIQMKHLEEELGAVLFERIGKRIRLTDQGRKFLDYAKSILDLEQQVHQDVGEENHITGTLRIGSSESILSYLMPNVLKDYSAQCPDVETSIKAIDIHNMYDAVNRNQIDCLVFIEEGKYNSEWVRAAQVPLRFVFICPTGHPLSRRRRVPLSEVLANRLALTERGLSYRDELDRMVTSKGFEIRPSMEIDNPTLLVQMVKNCGYISYLPEFVARPFIIRGEVGEIECNLESYMMLQMVYHKNKFVTPQMKIFQDCLIKVMKKL